MKKYSEMLKKTDYKTLLLIIANIIWMGVIFYFSSQPSKESSHISGIVTDIVLAVLRGIFFGNIPQSLEKLIISGNIIRKAGHVGEFFILGILVILLIRRLKVKKPIVVAILICVFYAVSDEFHQIFVPGRGPSIADVMLDSISSLIAIVLVNLTIYFNSMKKQK